MPTIRTRCIRFAASPWGMAVALTVFAMGMWLIPGCAVGRRESDGAIVLGFEAGKLVETGNQAIAGAAGALFGPAGIAVSGGALGLLGIAGKLWAKSAASTAAHEAERRGWEEAQATFSPPPPTKGQA